MQLTIVLKNGSVARVSEFEKINYFYKDLVTINSDFSNLFLRDETTYSFIGKNKVVIKGIEISYIDIQ